MYQFSPGSHVTVGLFSRCPATHMLITRHQFKWILEVDLAPSRIPSRPYELCGLAPAPHHTVRSANETHHRREASSSAYSHRMPLVSFRRNKSPSVRTLYPYGIHRKTVGSLIDRTDTSRQFLDRPPSRKEFSERSPVSLTWTPP